MPALPPIKLQSWYRWEKARGSLIGWDQGCKAGKDGRRLEAAWRMRPRLPLLVVLQDGSSVACRGVAAC